MYRRSIKMESKTLENLVTEEKKNYPAFKGNGVAIWINIDKNGNEYAVIDMVGHDKVPAWKFIPKLSETK